MCAVAIVVSHLADTFEQLERRALRQAPLADVVELRLDRAQLIGKVAHAGPSALQYRPRASVAGRLRRGESLERYIHRLTKLEEVATGFPGVRQAYAIQAGREVRVVVQANKVNDKQAAKLAREIARKVEDELTYPGEIKVTLTRETRVIEYAR